MKIERQFHYGNKVHRVLEPRHVYLAYHNLKEGKEKATVIQMRTELLSLMLARRQFKLVAAAFLQPC